MVDRIYPTELQFKRANSSDTEAPFLDLNLCKSNGTVFSKTYDKRDDFDFDIAVFPFSLNIFYFKFSTCTKLRMSLHNQD